MKQKPFYLLKHFLFEILNKILTKPKIIYFEIKTNKNKTQVDLKK